MKIGVTWSAVSDAPTLKHIDNQIGSQDISRPLDNASMHKDRWTDKWKEEWTDGWRNR